MDDYILYKLLQDGTFAGHFSEKHAKEIVKGMFHYEDNNKVQGERFCMEEAEKILNTYKSIIDVHVNVNDIYVAINAQYHDYAMLFKTWFTNGLEHRIVESAIVFWFKDPDYKGNKLADYFE